MFLVVSAGEAAVLFEEMSLRVNSGRDIEVGLTELTRDIQVLPDMFPVMFDETAAVPMPLPMVVETGPQDDIRRETAPAVVPLTEEMTLRVSTVGHWSNVDQSSAPMHRSNILPYMRAWMGGPQFVIQ